jgi:hypothetical protein
LAEFVFLVNSGLTQKAVQKKATGRALFSKLLYLVEREDFLKPNSTLNVDVLRNVRLRTHSDVSQLVNTSYCSILHQVGVKAMVQFSKRRSPLTLWVFFFFLFSLFGSLSRSYVSNHHLQLSAALARLAQTSKPNSMLQHLVNASLAMCASTQ